jgi:hypothetical protein
MKQEVVCHLEPFMGRAEALFVYREGAVTKANAKGRFSSGWKRENHTNGNGLGLIVRARANPLEAVGTLDFFDGFRRGSSVDEGRHRRQANGTQQL